MKINIVFFSKVRLACKLLKWRIRMENLNLRSSHGGFRTSLNWTARNCAPTSFCLITIHGAWLNSCVLYMYLECSLAWYSFTCYFVYRRILVYPKGADVGYLSIYLDAGVVNLPFGWSKFAHFKFSLINLANGKMTKIKGIFHPSLFSNWTFVWNLSFLAISYRGYVLVGCYIFGRSIRLIDILAIP